jgi:spore germination protein KA
VNNLYKHSRKNKANLANQPSDSAKNALSSSIEQNEAFFRQLLKNDDMVVYRHFENQNDATVKCCAIFVDGMINQEIINENIIGPVTRTLLPKMGLLPLEVLQTQVIMAHNIQKTADLDKIIEALNSGNTILFLDGTAEALIISSQGWKSRAITEPETEKSQRGPKEGFTESLMVNLSLLRRKLNASHQTKFKFKVLGSRVHTKACICYLEELVNPAILAELESRLEKVQLDAILGTNYVVEFIKDAPFSPFKTIGNTERPDVVAGKLLEGRIALLLDGSPVALTLPYIFIEYFQSNDDYFINFFYATISRLIRIASFIFTISVPAIYLALTNFHPEILPTPLLLSISSARQGIAFPTIIELLLLGFAFEIIREAGNRMPTTIGQALSIVGALILGQAAVEARIVSAPMVIVTGLTAVTGLMIPSLGGVIIILRFVFAILATFIGFYGYIFGVIGLLIHLFEIRSFGVPYMTPLNTLNLQEIKDTAVRAPWWYMEKRPRFIGVMNRIRQSPKKF